MSTLIQKKQKPLLSHKSISSATGVQLEKPAEVGNIINGLDKAIVKEKKKEKKKEKMKEKKKEKKKEIPKLPIAFKRKWLKALRSGEFVQVNGDLASKGHKINLSKEEQNAENNGWGYCVLGVAGKVAGYSDAELTRAGGELLNTFDVPDILKQDKDGNNHKIAGKLISMNDDTEKSFPKIADWIEENL